MIKFGYLKISGIFWALILSGVFSFASAQEKAKPEITPQLAASFTIAQLAVGTEIKDRELLGKADSFPATTEKVYCFLLAYDVTEDTEVTFVWYHGKNALLKTSFPLKKGARWRTFAYKNIYGLKGEWKVEIRDSTGKPLKEVKFKIE
ncbi:MAG: DUF2914 domain-containing protein [Thermodesulfobacteriota bacterium]